MRPSSLALTIFLLVPVSTATIWAARPGHEGDAAFPFFIAARDQARFDSGSRGPQPESTSIAVRLPPVESSTAEGERWVVDLVVEEQDSYRWLDRTTGSADMTVRLGLAGLRDREADCMVVASRAGMNTYRLSKTFRCFDPPGTVLVGTEARATLSGQLPRAVARARPVPALRWISSVDAPVAEWPKCVKRDGGWCCVGVAVAQPGAVVALTAPETLASLPVRTERGKSRPLGWRNARWGRLACLRRQDGSVVKSKVRIEKRVGWKAIRLRPAHSARVDPLGAGCYWLTITGSLSPLLVLDADGSNVGRRVLALGRLWDSPFDSPVAIRMDPPAILPGRLVPPRQGASLAVTEVELFSDSGKAESVGKNKEETIHAGFLLDTTKSDSRGQFEFADLAPGTYVVRACEPSLGCGESRVLAGGGTAKLRLTAPHYIEGKVTHAGELIENAKVSARPTSRTYVTSDDAVRLFVPPTRTDANGKFALALPARGVFRVQVEARGHATSFRRVGPVKKLPRIIDLGTIDLSDPVETELGLGDCPGGEILLVGPLGQDAIPESRKIPLDGLGRGTGEITASGDYAVMAKCGKRSVSVVPNPLHIPKGVSKVVEVLRRAYLATP